MNTHEPDASHAENTEPSPPMRRARLRRWGFRLLAVLGSLGLGLIVLEIAIRLIAPQPTHFYSFADFNLPDGTLRPGATGLLCGVPVEINAYGERGPAYSKQKPPGTLRVCVIGDSIVFGLGVPVEQAYPRVLERRLRKRLRHDAIEVIPFGQVHYHLSAYRERLLPKALSFEPDLVLIGFVLNDFERPPATQPANRTPRDSPMRQHGISGYATRMRMLTAELRKYSHLVYLVRKQAQVLLSTKLISHDELIHYWELECMYPDTEDFRDRWAYTVEQLDEMRAACRAQGVPLAITVTPFDIQLRRERIERYRQHLKDLPDSCLDGIPQRMLGEYASDRDIPFIDLLTQFRNHPEPVFFEVLEGRTDLCHPNAEGHRLMGEILADHLSMILSPRL